MSLPTITSSLLLHGTRTSTDVGHSGTSSTRWNCSVDYRRRIRTSCIHQGSFGCHIESLEVTGLDSNRLFPHSGLVYKVPPPVGLRRGIPTVGFLCFGHIPVCFDTFISGPILRVSSLSTLFGNPNRIPSGLKFRSKTVHRYSPRDSELQKQTFYPYSHT